jgi:hypothetical protein
MGTAAQETWMGKYFDQHKAGGGKILRQIVGGKPVGVARSVYQLEKPTVQDLVTMYARKYPKELLETTGIEYPQLLEMMKSGQLMKNLEKAEFLDVSTFLAAMKMKYTERVGYTIPEVFSIDDAAKWWGKYYKTGATQKQLQQYKANFSRHVPQMPQIDNTAGLTNNVMHEKRTQHQIQDVQEKTRHLFKIQ